MAGRGRYAGKKGMAKVITHRPAGTKHKKFPRTFVGRSAPEIEAKVLEEIKAFQGSLLVNMRGGS